MRGGLNILMLAATLPATAKSAFAQGSQPAANVLRTDSRMPYVHRLTLYDETGKAINPADKNAPPYSSRATCGKCHAYATIAHGWHFNAGDNDVKPGRPGEPWIFLDRDSGTQAPVSARAWRGALTPEQLGLSDWDMILTFGSHTTGGGQGEPDETRRASSKSSRWGISGKLEIDCMMCHAADMRHDPAESSRQIELQNFRWAATAALGLAVVRGEARKLPDEFDPSAPPSPDFPDQQLPRLIYDRARFDADNRVQFDIRRDPPPQRCEFCHTTRQVRPDSLPRSQTAADVHIAAGMRCTDCHRADIGHADTRGYANEAAERGNPALSALTCAGCHQRDFSTNEKLFAQHAAPRPLHRGLPAVHFERLTCTACHAGAMPQEQATRVQTAMAHHLGIAAKERLDSQPPEIVEPVFALDRDGRVAPHRLLWPAYWATVDGDKVTPVPVDAVRKATAAGQPARKREGASTAAVEALSDARIAEILAQLKPLASGSARSAYFHDGWQDQLDAQGRLERQPADAASAYLWPLAHDVRPAAQSLGARGCTDCHALDSPFLAGRVKDVEPVVPRPPRRMSEFRAADVSYEKALARGIALRPLLPWLGWTSCVALLLAALRAGMSGIDRLRGPGT